MHTIRDTQSYYVSDRTTMENFFFQKSRMYILLFHWTRKKLLTGLLTCICFLHLGFMGLVIVFSPGCLLYKDSQCLVKMSTGLSQHRSESLYREGSCRVVQ